MADPYVPFQADWKDFPDTTTPVTAAFLEYLETGVAEAISRAIVNAKGDLIAATADNAVARLAIGANDKVLEAASGETTGVKWDFPPGYEFGVTAITANVSVSNTAESVQDSVGSVTITADGAPLIVEFFSPRVALPAATSIGMVLSLWESTTNIARLAVLLNNGEATGTLTVPVTLKHRFTPSSGAHTYTVRAYMTATGTGTIHGGVGTGGAGIHVPSLLRVIKA